MKVSNMRNDRGNKVLNQFIITDRSAEKNTECFQSYDLITVRKIQYRIVPAPDWQSAEPCKGEYGKWIIHLDEECWDYSIITGKYRDLFLGETKKETVKKIESGEYSLVNLN